MVTIEDVKKAQRNIRGTAERTPLIFSESLSEKTGAEIYLKLDTLQPTGSFKIRGAANAVARLSEEERKNGVVTASTGNFGRALSYAGKQAGVPVTVCLSRLVPQNKVEAVRELGATVEICGNTQDEAMARAAGLVETQQMKIISPFDDADVIAGQGTIGLEILEDLPETDMAVIALSGGGLIAGIALALRHEKPDIGVTGVSTRQCPAMYESLKAGHPVDVPEHESVADSLGGGIGLENRYSFAMVRDLVGAENIVLLAEDEIKNGMCALHEAENIVAEGGGAVGVAALLAGKIKSEDIQGKKIVCHISGGNVAEDVFAKIVAA
ncbi:MAG: hydroxyectoine utilization dehydratase EutB [Micavibrio sp.]|nr:MAG: hydroxyectoine utilization dehydratase EutB [Micavibrio sp.]